MKVLKRGFIFSFLIYSLACVVSCGSQNSGFQQTDEGLSYKFYEIHPEAATPAVSDYLKLRMDYFLHDSLISVVLTTKNTPGFNSRCLVLRGISSRVWA